MAAAQLAVPSGEARYIVAPAAAAQVTLCHPEPPTVFAGEPKDQRRCKKMHADARRWPVCRPAAANTQGRAQRAAPPRYHRMIVPGTVVSAGRFLDPPQRAAQIHQLSRVPDNVTLGPPDEALVPVLITGRTAVLLALDRQVPEPCKALQEVSPQRRRGADLIIGHEQRPP
jgi:hypothetical protein